MKCHIPFLNFGQHLDEFYKENMTFCDKKQTLLYFENAKFQTNCQNGQVCQTFKYNYIENIYDGYNENSKNETTIRFILQDPEVVHFHTEPNYDLQSLISEIGGVLGITLGASAFSLSIYLCRVLQYFEPEVLKT